MESNNFLVFVRCSTYNHAAFIEDAMNGFCMQETTFPFVCCIIDDASTDGEPEIIRKYLNDYFDLEDESMALNKETDDFVLTFAQHKKNRNCYFAVFYLKYNHYSIKKSKVPYYKEWMDYTKYIAVCEGDDYWTVSHKLQKQYDFLESHTDFTCVFHRYKIKNELTKEFSLAPNKYFDDPSHRDKVFFEFNNEYNLLVQWTTKTLTMMFRQELYNVDYLQKFRDSRDVHLAYYLLSQGKGACMAFVGGVYNKNPRSIFGSKNRLERININKDVYKEFANKEHDFLLLETYNIFNDKYKLSTLNSCSLFFFKIKRRARLFLTKNKRKKLYGRILPNV